MINIIKILIIHYFNILYHLQKKNHIDQYNPETMPHFHILQLSIDSTMDPILIAFYYVIILFFFDSHIKTCTRIINIINVIISE